MKTTLRLPALALAALAALQAGCDKTARPEPPRPTTQDGGSAASPARGITPAPVDQPAASDRPGMPAIGAVEAGQARGGAVQGGAPEPSGGGDGAASAPAAAASR